MCILFTHAQETTESLTVNFGLTNLNVVDPVVELGDVHLSILITGLSSLEAVHDLVDLVLELLLTLLSLLSGYLKL